MKSLLWWNHHLIHGAILKSKNTWSGITVGSLNLKSVASAEVRVFSAWNSDVCETLTFTTAPHSASFSILGPVAPCCGTVHCRVFGSIWAAPLEMAAAFPGAFLATQWLERCAFRARFSPCLGNWVPASHMMRPKKPPKKPSPKMSLTIARCPWGQDHPWLRYSVQVAFARYQVLLISANSLH